MPISKTVELKPEKIEYFKKVDPSKLNHKELKQWLNWWQNNYSSLDYLKFLSTKNTDYLTLINHLYVQPKQKIIIENEEEKNLLNSKNEAEQTRNNMINDLKAKKFEYYEGFWNPNTVLLGGLGNDPIPDKENDPIINFKKSIENAKQKNRKINFFTLPVDKTTVEE